MPEIQAAELVTREPPTLQTVPQEIRDEIFKHLLVWKYPITIQRIYKTDNAPRIFMTCRQLHREASKYFYNNNVVSIVLDPLDVSYQQQTHNIKTHMGQVSKLCLHFPIKDSDVH